MMGKYKVVIHYRFDGEVYETPSVNSFDDIELARAEQREAVADGIVDDKHGRIGPEDIIRVEIVTWGMVE